MRIRHTEQPTTGHIGESEQDALELRAELDELFRARQYANQRERRLREAVRALPERQRPDGELLRQLDQARTLREDLGARCIELTEQLTALEGRLRQPAPRQGDTAPRQGGPAPRQPAGAGFPDGVYEEASAPGTPPPAPPATGARFDRPQPQPRLQPPPHPQLQSQPQPQSRSRSELRPQPQPQPAETAGATAAPPPPPIPRSTQGPRRRSPSELAALAEQVTALHRQGAAHAYTALLDEAATLLLPQDTAHLTGLLARGGPPDASLLLARGAARSTPAQAAGTLAELRQAGLAAEAAELFHALWSYPVAALPALLAALERAGQHADGATLLWEWGSAPTAELAALATALERGGRSGDARALLRQAAGRPTADLAALAGSLPAPLPAALLHDLAALRPSAELVALAAALEPHRELYGALLAALTADEVRHRSTLAALRTAGLPTTQAAPPRSRWGRR
ncbi:hypothetical protein J5Y04_19450 [Kitasatospora sp. RG8]|uniref:hypothetical protein n=1 Tax=Kitasatospora sp. RG8 TaxID=2820815 RepID=UPI001AE0CE14|nr:hypothetical protein [Kitasatospora sp. RG8]MBP0451703.1 hypothetical protein [Kitasatospora sp. RG8]